MKKHRRNGRTSPRRPKQKSKKINKLLRKAGLPDWQTCRNGNKTRPLNPRPNEPGKMTIHSWKHWRMVVLSTVGRPSPAVPVVPMEPQMFHEH